MKAKNIIGLKELRQNMDKYVKRAQERGESLVIMKRSKPYFRLSAVDAEEKGWETVLDFSDLPGGGISAHELVKRLKAM